MINNVGLPASTSSSTTNMHADILFAENVNILQRQHRQPAFQRRLCILVLITIGVSGLTTHLMCLVMSKLNSTDAFHGRHA